MVADHVLHRLRFGVCYEYQQEGKEPEQIKLRTIDTYYFWLSWRFPRWLIVHAVLDAWNLCVVAFKCDGGGAFKRRLRMEFRVNG